MADWIYKPLCIADFNIPNPDAVAGLDPAEAAGVKAALGFNAEHLPCHVMNGGERGLFYFRTSVAEAVVRDFFAEYIPEAKKRGVRVLVYFNVHWLNIDFGARHPEFTQLLQNGKPIDWLYDRGMSPCVNSEPYRGG